MQGSSDGVCRMSADSTAPDMGIQSSSIPSSGSTSMQLLQHLGSPFSEASDESRKRKILDDDSDICDDDDDCRSIKTDSDGKSIRPSNHSEIEKRRRDKMNQLIIEIASLVPMCAAMSTRKMDKLTVLRWAVQHIKSMRGSVSSFSQGAYKPSFVTDDEAKELLQQATDGFLLVIGCDCGKVLHVSDSVSNVIGWEQRRLVGQCWFQYVHPHDLCLLKAQMSPLEGRESFYETRGGTARGDYTSASNAPASLFCPGGKRAFYCRLRTNLQERVKTEGSNSSSDAIANLQRKEDARYTKVFCSGFLKSWPPAFSPGLDYQQSSSSAPDSSELSESLYNFTSLVLLVQPMINQSLVSQDGNSVPKIREFSSRLSLDGKFIFVDQRVASLLGYLPQELISSSYYEYIHEGDLRSITEAHESVLQSNGKQQVNTFRFKRKDGSFLELTAIWSAFRNPWTKEIQSLIIRHNVVISSTGIRMTGSSVATSSKAEASDSMKLGSTGLFNSGNMLPDGSQHGYKKESGNTKAGAGNIGTIVAQRAQVSSITQDPPFGNLVGYHEASQSTIEKRRGAEDLNMASQRQLGSENNRSPISGGSSKEESRIKSESTSIGSWMNLLNADSPIGPNVDFTEIRSWPL